MSRRAFFSTVAAATLFAASARADDASDLEGLLEQTVVETASQTAETSSTAPATSTIVTAEDLRRHGIRSLDEAINFLSLGMMATSPLHSVEVGARGVLLTSDYGNHMLLLVDGHVMNEQWDGTAYFERGAGIPFELIDRVELILGPGSVLYGSNAMLGVINVITKRAKDFAGGHAIVEADVPTSLRMALGYGREFRLLGVDAELTVQAEYYTQNGPTFTFGPQPYGADAVTGAPKNFGPRSTGPGVWGGRSENTYYTRIPSVYARLVAGEFEVSTRATSYKRATPYINGINLNLGDFDDPSSYEVERWLSLDVRHKRALSSVVDLRTRLYGDVYDYREYETSSAAEDCLPGQTAGCRRTIFGTSRWTGLELQGTFDWLKDGSLVSLVGVDGRLRHIEQRTDFVDAASTAVSTLGRDSRNEGLAAVYAQQTARLGRAIGLNAGVRFDADERFGTALSPRAAATWSTWDGGTLKAIYAEAFRAPTAYELYYADPATEVSATSLRPEHVRSVEGSFEQRFGAQRVFMGVFRSWWKDLISLEPLSPGELAQATASGQLGTTAALAYQYRNEASLDDYGWNGAYEGAAVDRRLRYGLNVTGSYARKSHPDAPSTPLTVAPQLFGNARVSYDLRGGWPTLALAGYAHGRALADRALDGGFTPVPRSPVQLVLRGTVSGPMPGVRGLSYRASATWSGVSHTAYVAGPNQAATPQQPAAELAPVDRFRTTVGLQYDF